MVRGDRASGADEPDEAEIWSDGRGFHLSRIAGDEPNYRLRFLGTLAVDIFLDRRMVVDRSDPAAPADALDHLLSNQIAPRILAHAGELVLHASGVMAGDRAILMLGESGSGKSTLAASFDRCGHELIADDGIVAALRDGHVLAEPVQPSLRLRADSVSALFGDAAPPFPPASVGGKLRIPIRPNSDAACPYRVAAIFVLQPAAPGAAITISRLTVADACIAMIANSFELDPTDLGRAAAKLARAASVAHNVPTFALSYPRDFPRLPEVRSAMLAALP